MKWAGFGGTIATGLLGAASTYRSGGFQQIEYNERAQAELDASRDREIDRRRRLVAALASQNAEAGAIGAAPGVGSRAAQARADARRAAYETGADRATTGRRALLLRKAGSEAKRQAGYLTAATLLDTGLGALDTFPGH